ncbi:MAG: DNA mismatch repair protein MutT, partial [Candidatus Aenigmatarchaeota archaeon]
GTFKAQAHGKPEGVLVQMTCYSGNFTGDMRPSSEIETIGWLNSQADKKLLSPVDVIIFSWLKDRDMID